jgi:hypothetical protein
VSGHEINIIDKQGGERCANGWIEKVWSQTGPQGPQGETGAAGTQGPAGAPGPALAFYTRGGSQAISANPDQDDVLTDEVFCDSGDTVTGGGWELGTNPSPNVQVLAPVEWLRWQERLACTGVQSQHHCVV